MKRNRKYHILLAGLAALCITACGRLNPDGASSLKGISYGSCANMKTGGLVDADDQKLFFVWEDTLYYMDENNSGAKAIDSQGADSLCLTPDGLFYGSYDEQGVRGIYRMEADGTQKTLLYQTDFTGLYAAGSELIFLEKGNVCSVLKKDGGGYRVLYEGNYEALSVADGRLYFRDRDTGAYYGRQLGTEQTPLSDSDILLTDSGETMPVAADGWIYYDNKQWMQTNRTRTDGSETQQKEISSNALLAQGNSSFSGNLRTDWESGETTQWTERSDVRIVGFAGTRILYEAYSYDIERMTDTVVIPQEVELILHDTAGTQPDVILQVRSQADRAMHQEKAEERFRKLLAGRRILLRNEAEGFFEALDKDENITWLLIDADGDRSDELFVRTNSRSYVFHAAADGVYCWLAYANQEESYVEPLTDGSFLYRTTYRMDGIVQEMYDIYRFRPGGKTERINTYQHMQLDLDVLQIDKASESHIKENSYYAQDKFVTAGEWQAEVAKNVTALLIPAAGYKSYSSN